MRTLIAEEPYLPKIANTSWINQGIWPCHWISLPEPPTPPFVGAYRVRFQLEEAAVIRVHVTADEGYELFVDGERIGRGPERGDPRNWFFESYDLALVPGEHTIVARSWALGSAALRSQMSLAPGFLLSPDDEKYLSLLGTGVAKWEAKRLEGYEFIRPFSHDFFSVGYGVVLHGKKMEWDWKSGGGSEWQTAAVKHPGSSATLRNRVPSTVHLLTPATLPPMREKTQVIGKARYVGELNSGPLVNPNLPEADRWNELLQLGKSLTIPARTALRVIIDMEDYITGYSEVRLRNGGGASWQMFWAESLFNEADARTKGNRNEIEDKFFVGYGDVFHPAGSEARTYESLSWHAGRYIELQVQTGDEPLIVEKCEVRTTRYPWEPESTFEASDASLARLIPLGLRALQSSCHDSYMDGPYYEQMMWAGDGVQNTLTTYVQTLDDKLARKMLRLFDSSRLPSGFTAARWPARDTLIIAPYSLLWVSMVRDYAFWRDDPDFVQGLLPGVRAVTEAFLRSLTCDGLLRPPMGWNFIDWVPGWPGGMAPGAEHGVSGILNWQLVRTLGYVAELEEAAGEPELAQRARRRACDLAKNVTEAFWEADRGLFADNLEKTSFSEHAQVEAILSGELDAAQWGIVSNKLLEDTTLARTTISYSHYLFEAYRKIGRVDALLGRLDLWHALSKRGLLTTPEGPEPTRSDCHAWGAHPIYHFFASILGLRPASPGFRSVRMEPQLGSLAWAKGKMVHPRGEIRVEVESQNGSLHGEIQLPEGLGGMLVYSNVSMELKPGTQQF